MHIIDLPSQLSLKITHDDIRFILCSNQLEFGIEENIPNVLTCYDWISQGR